MTNKPEGRKLRISSVLFVGPAVLLSLALIPDDMALIPIMLLSLLRMVALIVGLICLIAAGRLSQWSIPMAVQILIAIAGVVVMSFVVFSWQMMRQDYLPPIHAWIYIVLARVLPLAVVAGALWPSRLLYFGAFVVTLVAGINYFATAEKLGSVYAEQKRVTQQAQWAADAAAQQAHVADRLAALARVPAEAGVEPLLVYIYEDEPEAVQKQAAARLNSIPNISEQLAGMMNGDRRLDALVALTLRGSAKFPIPDAIVQRAWIVSGSIARDMIPTMGAVKVVTPETVKLCRSLGWLSTQRDAALIVRTDHRAELQALRDWLGIIQWKVSLWCGGGPATMDAILAAP